MPVFPDVPSMIIPPGFNLPSFSATSTIFKAIRSLIELPGLKYSTFAKIVQGKSLVILFNLIRGVLPIVSKMLLSHIKHICGKGRETF